MSIETQARIGQVIGIPRETIRNWLDENTSNGHLANACNPAPRDCRIKLTAKDKERIRELIQQGMSQQEIAAEYHVTQQRIAQLYARFKREAQADQRRNEAAASAKQTHNIVVGDFRKLQGEVKDGSVDLIFTDPPYDRKSLKLYADLGQFAAKKLEDGGSLLAYCGQYLIGEVIQALSRHLRFWWVIACLHKGPFARMREYGVIVQWKPIVWFVKGNRANKQIWVMDRTECQGGKEKEFHKWGQAESEAAGLISTLCPKNGLVCDPFLGGGTTGLAAQKLQRRWIGFEIEPQQARLAAKRIFG